MEYSFVYICTYIWWTSYFYMRGITIWKNKNCWATGYQMKTKSQIC